MAKVQIKSEKITPFGGIFHVREQFSRYVGPVIDKVLGLRCTSFGYQYGEIVGSLSSVYFCGGDCVEDVTSHLMPHPFRPRKNPSRQTRCCHEEFPFYRCAIALSSEGGTLGLQFCYETTKEKAGKVGFPHFSGSVLKKYFLFKFYIKHA